jgi:hypothetical protein
MLMVGLLFFNSPNIGVPHTPRGHVRTLSSILTAGAERFVCGHEVGHIELGHLAREAETTKAKVGSCEVEVVKLPPEKELEADSLAASVLGGLVAMNKFYDDNMPLAILELCSAPFLFNSLEIYDRCYFRLCPKNTEHSHPPPPARSTEFVKKIHYLVLDRLNDSARGLFYSHVLQIDIIAERIFKRFEDFYIDRKKE